MSRLLSILFASMMLNCFADGNGSFHSSQEIADFQSINVPASYASGRIAANSKSTVNGDDMISKMYPGDGFTNEQHPGNGSFHSANEVYDYQSTNVPAGYASGRIVNGENTRDNGDGMIAKMYPGNGFTD